MQGKTFTLVITRPRADGTEAKWKIRGQVTEVFPTRIEYKVLEVLSEENVVSKGEMDGGSGGLSIAAIALYRKVGRLVWL